MSRALALVDSADDPRREERPIAPGQLLETKLYVPRVRSGLVARARLVDAVRQGVEHKLTVVAAPPGFGKTTLLAGWVAEAFGPTADAAWLSLDAGENEPAVFWTYFIAAVRKIHPAVGAQALTLLQSSQPAPIEAILGTLINDIEALHRDLAVVLDDYHLIVTAAIHEGMNFLLDRMPHRMHVVIASRTAPPLALARLRVRGELAELDTAQLRFTVDETSAFFRLMSVDLSPEDTLTLERRTEGWIAALKLAALSMKGRDNVREFVNAFSGDHRYIADYLVEEALTSQPEHIRRFLRTSAILERLSGPLCDAITEQPDSQAILEELERRNLFVVALDDRRQWYRYHHLFAEVLRTQAAAADPEGARAAHRRASLWCEAHDARREAVRHALAGEDIIRAADLLERTWPEKNRSYESRTWLDQVKTLPESLLRGRPALSMGYAWALVNGGELEAAEPRLRDVEVWLAAQANAPQTDALGRLRSEAAAARVYLTQSLGEIPGTLEHAQRALELCPAGDIAARATGTALVALAHWGRGELDAAHHTFGEALTLMREGGGAVDAIRGTFVLGDIRVAQGRLHEAARLYESGLRLAADGTFAAPPETDELYIGLSEVYREWNDIARASQYLDTLSRTAATTTHLGNRLRWCTAMAAVRAASGNIQEALDLLDEAERHERRDPLPRTRPIPAMKARLFIASGRISEANAWATAAAISTDDDLSFVREFDHVTLAQLLIARKELASAEHMLGRLHAAAVADRRAGSVIEILILKAIAQYASNNVRPALDLLGEALVMAEPEGFLRVFVDRGTRMRDLLRHAVTRGLAGEHARFVLAAFDARPDTTAAVPDERATSAAPSATPTLTTREMEILRLIAAGLRNQEIAGHLSISAATVKRHIANIYAKLGAAHRTEALVRAKALHLL